MSPGQPDLVALAKAGKRLRYPDGPPAGEVAERMLEVPTVFLREAASTLPGLEGFDLEEALAGLSHEWLEYRGLRIHLEVHQSAPEAPSVVIAPGLGDHARRLTPLAAGLRGEGYNALVVDRQGHGISEGRRGDATLEDDFGVLELAIAHARSRYGGPVVVGGDSLGGIMTWYLLTHEPDVEAAFCHDILHPDVYHDRSARFKAPLVRALARVAPRAPLSVRQVADYDEVALEPFTKRYFDSEQDRLFNFSVSLRSVASYLGFRPGIPWERVELPVLVLAGAEDRMVPRQSVEAALARAKPPRTTYLPIEGAGHQLFLDHLRDSLPALVGWTRAALAHAPAPAPA
jgi:alpha-beta hydrolase superfamily lysophospholipase